MTIGYEAPPAAPPSSAASAAVVPRRQKREWRGGNSVLAFGEPLVWLTGGGLLACVLMIVGLLLLVLYQGVSTFWPLAVVQVRTTDDRRQMGEVSREETFELSYSGLSSLSPATRQAARRLLSQRFHAAVAGWISDGDLGRRLAELSEPARKTARRAVEMAPLVRDAAGRERTGLLTQLDTAMQTSPTGWGKRLDGQLRQAVAQDPAGESLDRLWADCREQEDAWLAQPDVETMTAQLRDDDELAYRVWANHALSLMTNEVAVPMQRRLLRTGNYELTNEHFAWISQFEVAAEEQPAWALVFERLSWGRFYGIPKAMVIDQQTTAAEPAQIWAQFLQYHPEVRARWRERRRLEIDQIGEINRRLEEERLAQRQVELEHGRSSAEWQAAQQQFQKQQAELDQEFARLRARIVELDRTNEKYQLLVQTAQGQDQSLPLADIVRAYPANQLGVPGRLGIYLSRWAEFLLDDPREANTEGGVLPAIWGTVAMTLLMSCAVVPFGVLAALYLREYAKAGLLVSIVRIAINNLAGVPSIVFGVFGLGFFCYILGASLDQMLFSAKLPSPTFGTGGLFWAALTLSLLTLPVVIVATEEALAAVPRSMREGSLACGASKWQTIQRIVLPRAMPGIMTGMILAMARGAGEVAPLMLVGAVKLAPELPVDGVFPYVHLERSFMHLGFHIYDLGFQSQNSEAAKPMVFTTTLLLITLITLLNVFAIWLRGRLRRKFVSNAF
ncbi:MAG: phosphate ABC transporter permease PstA [Pirellulaceae bacterium]|nr:phosphate ABC transporter permease PstA [Pirellulaceae bacterium]